MDDLAKLLDVERLDSLLFRSRCHQDNHRGSLFGGQILGQSLVAACRTVENRLPHSYHAYFLRAGSNKMPVIFDVDPIRDGGSFTTRRVVAKQNSLPIFSASISFHKQEEGWQHQSDPISMPPLPTTQQQTQSIDDLRAEGLDEDIINGLPEVNSVSLVHAGEGPRLSNECRPAMSQVWFKPMQELPNDPILQLAATIFSSDLCLLGTALKPHPTHGFADDQLVTSLDHSIWFHAVPDTREWQLYELESPWAGGGRGLGHGRIYSANGLLLASVAQEGLIRQLTKGPS